MLENHTPKILNSDLETIALESFGEVREVLKYPRSTSVPANSITKDALVKISNFRDEKNLGMEYELVSYGDVVVFESTSRTNTTFESAIDKPENSKSSLIERIKKAVIKPEKTRDELEAEDIYRQTLEYKEERKKQTLWDAHFHPFLITEEVGYRMPSFDDIRALARSEKDTSFVILPGGNIVIFGFEDESLGAEERLKRIEIFSDSLYEAEMNYKKLKKSNPQEYLKKWEKAFVWEASRVGIFVSTFNVEDDPDYDRVIDFFQNKETEKNIRDLSIQRVKRDIKANI